MRTLSEYRHLKVNFKEKNYLYVTFTSQRCPNKIIIIFLTEGFFHLLPVSTTLVVHLELQISFQIFKEIQKCPIDVLRGLTETDS